MRIWFETPRAHHTANVTGRRRATDWLLLILRARERIAVATASAICENGDGDMFVQGAMSPGATFRGR
jgi:hypothetical protein